MTTTWLDYRNGDSDDSGQWQLQFSMSGQYVGIPNLGIWIPSNGDYNTIWSTTEPQVIIQYGSNGGFQ